MRVRKTDARVTKRRKARRWRRKRKDLILWGEKSAKKEKPWQSNRETIKGLSEKRKRQNSLFFYLNKKPGIRMS